jgi:ubiquinone/menaquinone biosynthesis C-methylase UbiE
MTYTIEETDLERQHLLAQFLEPISLNALKKISLPKHATILDIGCGLGDTTLMLNERFPNSTITGLDGDDHLIDAAIKENKSIHPNFNFICGDALHLPFEDNSFDFVFSRYCLHHVQDIAGAFNEIKRVCKRDGMVFIQDPDANFFQSYPESDAYPQFRKIVNHLFADALLGRKLLSFFKKLSFQNVQYDAQIILADHTHVMKKFYRMTAEAMRHSILQKMLLNPTQFDALVEELKTIEMDEDAIVLTHPIIAVWGTKPETISSNYTYQHER